jgi:hypothetical protein
VLRAYPQRTRWNPLASCKIDPDSSPQFNVWRNHWRKSGYPSIDADLAEAFQAISKDVQAKHRSIVPRFGDVLGDFALHKYRQRNKAAKEGASGAWRIYALFNRETNVLYPIIVFPKKAWADASDRHVTECVKELVQILRERQSNQAS